MKYSTRYSLSYLSIVFRYYVQFLDECLRAHKDNILQENLFIVLTSMEMIALCRVMAILHFKICMPMRWLAGNTHSIGQTGFNWSARSMGKAIDALHDAMTEIEQDGSKFLDEDFMNDIFSKIYENEDGEQCPLQPLVDAMKFQFEEKQTTTMDGSKVLPFDQLNAELFYPDRKENIETTDTVLSMAVEMAKCMIEELENPTKATSDYLSCIDGKFSWGETTDDEHHACIGRMATNDPAESPFAALTRQMQQYGRLLGIHAAGMGQAKYNGDFYRDIKDKSKNGLYHQLPPDMHASLLKFALKIAPEVRKAESAALDRQRAAKAKRQALLRKKKLEACQREYANALTYIEMYHSRACWRTATEVRRAFSELTSETARKEAVKEQIRLRVVGFGWKDLHHPWSKDGIAYSAEYLRDYLIKSIIPEQKKRDVPEVPPVTLPSRAIRCQLGTRSADVDDLEKYRDDERVEIIDGGKKLRDTLEQEGVSDRYEKMQGTKPPVDASLIGARIEQLWNYTEEDGTVVPQWCQGVVVAVKKQDKVHIEWDDACFHIGDQKITEERLLKTKWNKQVEGAWRWNLD